MKTYFVRYERQCASALKVAEWLSEQKGIKNVMYPGLPSHPQYLQAKYQSKDFGGLVTFDVEGGDARLLQVLSRLKLFQVVGSVGSTESLAAPCQRFFGGDLGREELLRAGIHEGTIRLSIGLESCEDLIEDLKQALQT
jgi:methionine-gamma-lyase